MSSKVAEPSTIHKALFDPKALLQSVVNELKHMLGNTGPSFQLMAEGLEEALITDPNILRKIITKLLAHIIERMPNGKIEILMESNFCEPNSLLILIEGHELLIPEIKLARLFSRKGSALAEIKSLVKQLGGNIKAENGIGKGTTFIAILPVKYLSSSEFLSSMRHD